MTAAAQPAPIKPEAARVPAPISVKPAAVTAGSVVPTPPLAVSDYENYIKSPWNAAQAISQSSLLAGPPLGAIQSPPIISKRLDAITAPMPIAAQPSDVPPSRLIEFAIPATPIRPDSRVAFATPSVSKQKTAVAPAEDANKAEVTSVTKSEHPTSIEEKSPSDLASQSTGRSLLVSRPNTESPPTNDHSEPPVASEVEIRLVKPKVSPQPAAVVAQSPTPREPQPEPVIKKAEKRPLVVAAPMPITREPQPAPVARPIEKPQVAATVPAPAPREPQPAPVEPQVEKRQFAAVAPAPAPPAPRPAPAEPRADEQPLVVIAQAPTAPKSLPTREKPKTAQTSIEPESIPIVSGGEPVAPMTNSSFLPANPESYCFRCGVKCPPCGCNPGGPGWNASRPIPWEVFAQGEYVGPARLAHVPVYRLRVDDRLSFVFRLSGQVAGQPYRLNVRDHIQVQSLQAPEVVNREVVIQPDGTITLPLIGQVRAAGSTIDELSRQLDEQFKRQIKDPRITILPLVVNSNLEELRMSVDRRYGQGGLGTDARVSPDGTIQLPAIGSVPVQGLTLEELEREVKTRYALIVEGLEVTPILLERAPRFLYVVGEVKLPGRFTMEGPTTLMQAIAMAGSYNVGAQLDNVVVFRRDENWQLMATKVNIRSSLLFKKPCPAGEIWLRDSDVVLVPKSPILCADDFIELVFTRGIYGVFPMSAQLNFSKLSSL